LSSIIKKTACWQ